MPSQLVLPSGVALASAGLVPVGLVSVGLVSEEQTWGRDCTRCQSN